MPLNFNVTWKFHPAQVSAFYNALRPMQAKLINEKKCLYFNVFEVGPDKGVVRVVETWDCDMKWIADVRVPLGGFNMVSIL
jgi:quinol monooxygenase YgiN